MIDSSRVYITNLGLKNANPRLDCPNSIQSLIGMFGLFLDCISVVCNLLSKVTHSHILNY